MLLPLYNQADKRWRSTPLGTTGRTLGSDGCAITSLAMVVGEEPPVVLQKAKAQGAIAASGDFFWPAVQAMYSSFYFSFRWSTTNEAGRNEALRLQPDVAALKTLFLLAVGQPVILRVIHPIGTGHFVVAMGFDGTDLIIADPDGGKQVTYASKFGDFRQNLQAVVVLVGPAREPVDCGPDITKKVIQKASISVFKASQLQAGRGVATYSKEILDTFL